MKYRKRPVEIDAVEWKATADSWREIQDMGNIKWDGGEMGSESFYLETLEGKMRVTKGDFVICGVKGEFYPCKPDIFQLTYELATQPNDGTSAQKQII